MVKNVNNYLWLKSDERIRDLENIPQLLITMHAHCNDDRLHPVTWVKNVLAAGFEAIQLLENQFLHLYKFKSGSIPTPIDLEEALATEKHQELKPLKGPDGKITFPLYTYQQWIADRESILEHETIPFQQEHAVQFQPFNSAFKVWWNSDTNEKDEGVLCAIQ